METIQFARSQHLTPMALKVASILVRDGGITHLTALHYDIGSVTKEIARIRKAYPLGYRVKTVKRKDADGRVYTRWTLARAEAAALLKEAA
jgi:hypothetical protein